MTDPERREMSSVETNLIVAVDTRVFDIRAFIMLCLRDGVDCFLGSACEWVIRIDTASHDFTVAWDR